eukprot:CAMPEP_0184859298 /NCGR_PEP_ID=MMETSP0580-20130426/4300_1 /TAXON_ID=1118495 /ORGANISM="Dactyliosolen fragilissimus" /LENGTH=237 /DNA_ID=CAMNT_0027355843 /DNA_START=669 /DNA_END=1379 /DNA_ORIENTATION=+
MKPTPILLKQLENEKGPTDVSRQKALVSKYGFSYHQAIGGLLFAAVTCRPDIIFYVIKLSQYSTTPADHHFLAVKNSYRYLRTAIDHGIIYWRKCPQEDLPDKPPPDLRNDTESDVSLIKNAEIPTAFVGSDWAGDTATRKSVSGTTLYMAGGPIIYRSRQQPTVSLSSTEAEFIAALDAGRSILYLRSILDDLDIDISAATDMFINNAGARQMANAQCPTLRTRHLNLRYFSLLEW